MNHASVNNKLVACISLSYSIFGGAAGRGTGLGEDGWPLCCPGWACLGHKLQASCRWHLLLTSTMEPRTEGMGTGICSNCNLSWIIKSFIFIFQDKISITVLFAYWLVSFFFFYHWPWSFYFNLKWIKSERFFFFEYWLSSIMFFHNYHMSSPILGIFHELSYISTQYLKAREVMQLANSWAEIQT